VSGLLSWLSKVVLQCDGLLLCAAKNAKDNLNYKEVNGKPIRIMWANRNPTARKSKEGNIFIKVGSHASLANDPQFLSKPHVIHEKIQEVLIQSFVCPDQSSYIPTYASAFCCVLP
jgi:hypothetical protein